MSALRSDHALGNLDLALAAIVGSSGTAQRLRARIRDVASLGKDVFIHGEPGTGKELVARAVHAGARPKFPFISLNGAALGNERAESDLFGNKAGAWTDARKAQPGLLQEAGHGTLFLDEVATLPIAVQVKLLRLFEQREYRTVGGSRLLHFEGQFITATNEDLTSAVESGTFRRDLYGRVRRTPIFVAPLRDRVEDIEELLDHHAALERVAVRWAPSAISFLQSQAWPNNVRELFTVAEDASLPMRDRALDADDLSKYFHPSRTLELAPAPPSTGRPTPSLGWRGDDSEAELRRALSKWLEGRPTKPLAQIGRVVLEIASELAMGDTNKMATLLERPRRSVQHLLTVARVHRAVVT